MKGAAMWAALLFASGTTWSGLAPVEPLPALDMARYAGTWYQVALYPNRFQAQCVGDTVAMYRILPAGTVEVRNRCRTADGRLDEAMGLARPDNATIAGATLSPARLQVSFLPSWLRWTGIGWGRYWVMQLADDYRYAVIGEPTREYLWILSRQPQLSLDDERSIHAKLVEQGFDLGRLQTHPQSTARRPPSAPAAP